MSYCPAVLKVPLRVVEQKRPGLPSLWSTEYETIRCAVPAGHDGLHASSGSDHVRREWPRRPIGAPDPNVSAPE